MNTRLKAIWFNTHGFEDELWPYKLVCELIYRNLLNQNVDFTLPGYEFIYVDIGRKELLPVAEPSSISTSVAVEFDINRYKQADENTKEEMVISLFADSLTRLAIRDGFATKPIDEATETIRQYKGKTLLNIKVVDTDKYYLTITIPAISWIQPEPVYLNLLQKSSGKSGAIRLGTAGMIQAAVWLQKVTVTATTIRIKSSTSARFVELLKELPQSMSYKMEDILSGKFEE